MTLLRRSIQALLKQSNTERPPVAASSHGLLSGISGGVAQSNQIQHMQAMTTSSWLFAVVDRIAASAAAVPWDLYRTMPNGQRQLVPSHPVKELWASVNPFHTRHEFIETSVQHFELTGEIWWLIVRNGGGKAVELWNIRPDRIRPVPSTKDFIAGYIYTVGNVQVPLQRNDVIFIKRPSPLDPYRGIGTVQSMMVDLSGDQMASSFTRNFFTNGAMPGGILQFDEGLSDADFERLVTRWSEQHQGVANAHRVAVLERGKWVDRTFSVKDMVLPELRRLNRDIVFGAYGIPSSAMGVTESVNRANAEAGDLLFARWILNPLLERIKQAVNERLVHTIDKGLVLDYTDPTPENRELHLKIADTGFKGGYLTKNETRALLGYGETDGGNEFTGPAPAGPISFAVEEAIQKAASEIRDDEINKEEDRQESRWVKRLQQERDGFLKYLEEVS
jgi:HK97 family phage portal protein